MKVYIVDIKGYTFEWMINIVTLSFCSHHPTSFKFRKLKTYSTWNIIQQNLIKTLAFFFSTLLSFVQMAAIFPILDTYWCIATKWTRHMGFCLTYTSLLMKTWRWVRLIIYAFFLLIFTFSQNLNIQIISVVWNVRFSTSKLIFLALCI